jgi:siroheme synthase
MPGFHYRETADQLIDAGLNPATPCAIVSRATSKQQQVYRTTVADLPAAPQLPAPTLLLIGDVLASEPAVEEMDHWKSMHPIERASEPQFVFDTRELGESLEWRQ